jgi:3-deoxy-D-manno-octulosonate 8-phosphate phosphatase (KDO 8-P phosphatase)
MVNKIFNDIKLIVYDFDGVMTDNKVFIDQSGNEMVKVNRGDGLAISEIKKIGIKQIIISTEVNPVVNKRASKLRIPYIQGVIDKRQELINYCTNNKIDLKNVAYVGNDINDLEVMKIVAYSICPSDAQQEIKNIVDLVIKKNGGDGVIRELLNIINEVQGKTNEQIF